MRQYVAYFFGGASQRHLQWKKERGIGRVRLQNIVYVVGCVWKSEREEGGPQGLRGRGLGAKCAKSADWSQLEPERRYIHETSGDSEFQKTSLLV